MLVREHLDPTVKGLHQEPFERPIVEWTDQLIGLANKNHSRETVRWTPGDEETIQFMYKGFQALYPKSSQEFENKMAEWKPSESKYGVSQEAGGAVIRHLLEVPQPLYRMFQVIFPQQKWDKKFCIRLSRVLPVLRSTADKL